MIKAIKKYLNLSISEKLLFLETYFISFYVRYLIRFYPMKKYANKLGQENITSKNIDSQEIIELKKYIVNIKRVSKYSFWRTKCFEEAFALKLILNKKGYSSTIYFGVSKDNGGELLAHSWLKIGDIVIIGNNGLSKYTITKYFT